MSMQKTKVSTGIKYRLITNGTVYKIQWRYDHIDIFPWEDYVMAAWMSPPYRYTTRFKWLAKRKLDKLRTAEAKRRAKRNTIWETVKD